MNTELEKAKKAIKAWIEYAEHLEVCWTCYNEGIDKCKQGHELYKAAHALTDKDESLE